MSKLLYALGGLLALPLLMLSSWHALTPPQTATASEQIATTFKGRLLAASDADMVAYGYANGITDKVAGIEDSLALIELVQGAPTIVSQLSASNSVISWPDILAWHPEKNMPTWPRPGAR